MLKPACLCCGSIVMVSPYPPAGDAGGSRGYRDVATRQQEPPVWDLSADHAWRHGPDQGLQPDGFPHARTHRQRPEDLRTLRPRAWIAAAALPSVPTRVPAVLRICGRLHPHWLLTPGWCTCLTYVPAAAGVCQPPGRTQSGGSALMCGHASIGHTCTCRRSVTGSRIGVSSCSCHQGRRSPSSGSAAGCEDVGTSIRRQ